MDRPDESLRLDQATLSSLEQRAAATRDAFLEELSTGLEEKVLELLQKEFGRTVRQVLGFDIDRWSDRTKWELDHCNGRNGNSIIGSAIQSQVEVHLSKLIADAINKMDLKGLERQVQEEYRRVFRNKLSAYAIEGGEREARRVWEEIAKGDYVSKEQMTQTLSELKREGTNGDGV